MPEITSMKMRKFLLFIILFFVIGNSFAQELIVTQKVPDTAIPGGNYTVEITIIRKDSTGFMKLFQGVPAGCSATEMESKGGSFSFADGGVKIIWITLPAENQFTISYQVSIPKDVAGTKKINGKVAYLYNTERRVYDMETKTIKIGDPLATPTTETVLVTGSDHAMVTSSPILKPKEEDLAPSRMVVDTAVSIVAAKKEEEKTSPPPAVVKEEKPIVSTPVPEKTSATGSPVTKEEKTPAPVNMPTSPNVPVTAIPSSYGKTFRVQIGAFTLKPVIKDVQEPSTVVLENGVKKYFSGNFATYEEATKRKIEVIEKGYKGAFVVSFQDGKIVK